MLPDVACHVFADAHQAVFLASTEDQQEDATAGTSVYVFENWAPLQRPAKAMAAALRDAALWGAFGIRVRVRPAR